MHEKAAEAYDAKMTEMVAQLHERPAEQSPKPDTSPSAADVHSVKTLGPSDLDITMIRLGETDYTGENVACYFYAAGKMIGLDGDAHKTLLATTRRIASSHDYRERLSEKYVYDQAIGWLQARANTLPEIEESFTTFLDAHAAVDVAETELWFPIPILQVDVEFTIGPAIFRRITKAMMDQLALSTHADRSPEELFAFNKLRSRLQAAGAACITVRAEPIRARERAEREIELSVAALRLACPAMFNVYQWAPLHPDFLGHVGTATALRVQQGQIVGTQSGLHPRMLGQWRITATELERQKRRLWKFADVLLTGNRNEFQEVVLGALVQYSRSVLKPDVSERLLYIISALELLFVNKGEPIGQNLRERLAILKAPPAANRTAFVQTVNRVYELRSAFVHGGVALADLTELETFLVEAWATFTFVLNNHDKWRTKSEFIAALDAHKFSAEIFSTRGMPAV